MKLHLGCGKRHIPGWFHIDVVPFDHVDLVSAVDSLPTIPSDSVELIYACHILEHFNRRIVKDVLTEWKRVLRPGGVLRLAVPDFQQLVESYSKDRGVMLEQIIGPIFGRQDYLYNVHYNVFDYMTLKPLLLSCGFSSVRRYNWRETEHAHIDDYSQSYLPHMDKENGRLISLNVEAIK